MNSITTGPIRLDRGAIDAFVFDLDGVLTDTASLHMQAWKETFDELLEGREDVDSRPFTEADYLRYVDGKPRYAGVSSFLASRGLELPPGDAEDPPGAETVRAVGDRKNRRYLQLLDEKGVRPFDDAVRFVEEARRAGFGTAMITSSRNGRHVIRAAGMRELFDTVLDGEDADELRLPGKPRPDVFVAAARSVHAPPERTAIFEDSEAGVEAGLRGGFGRVVGVDRSGSVEHAERLGSAGADLVVASLSELTPTRP